MVASTKIIRVPMTDFLQELPIVLRREFENAMVDSHLYYAVASSTTDQSSPVHAYEAFPYSPRNVLKEYHATNSFVFAGEFYSPRIMYQIHAVGFPFSRNKLFRMPC